MKIKDIKLVEKFEKFISGIKDSNVAVLHHTDPDGVCSGVIISKVVERVRGRPIDLRVNQKSSELFVTDRIIKQLKERKIKRVIITDMAVDQVPEKVKELASFAKVLILDHHKIYTDMNSESIVMIKPHMIFKGMKEVDSAHYPAAKLCYELGLRVVDINDLDWVAVIAIIGDFGFNEHKEWIDEVFKRNKIKKKEKIFHTDLGKIASMMSMTEAYDVNKVKICYETVYNAKNYKDVLRSDIRKYSEKVRTLIDHYLQVWEQEAETYPEMELIFYLIKPKYNVKSTVSTIISTSNPGKAVIIVADTGEEFVTISARRQDRKVKMNNLLEKSVEGLEKATAGGHIPAAGGRFLRKDLDKFKKNLLRELKKAMS